MTITYDDVQNILKVIDSSALEEIHLELGDFKLVVRRHGAPGAAVLPVEPAPARVAAAAPTAAPAVAAPAGATPAAGARPTPARPTPHARGVEVRAPMVGTFYRAPSPGAPPFVEVGSLVKEDDTVCILEVMKLMNSITAGVRGRVVEICVENATLVEFGATLVVIEPTP
jgi:acetyl-CoA carboxylase biotin carboxyl carrier protein